MIGLKVRNVANLPLGWKDCRGAILKTKIRQTLGCGIIMHATSPAASRETDSKAGQEIDHTACRQMDRGRAGDRSYSMPADGQRQGRRWIIHAGRWTEAGQEIDHTGAG